jgi:hypothetical protein
MINLPDQGDAAGTIVTMRVLIVCFLFALCSCIPRPRHGERRTAERPQRGNEWNQHAKQFIWPPAFALRHVDGAAAYRFTAVGEDGVAQTFNAPRADASLDPIWEKLPIGKVTGPRSAFLSSEPSTALLRSTVRTASRSCRTTAAQ